MSKSRTTKRLANLAGSGVCTTETAANLKETADKNLSLKDADAKSRLFKALADDTRLRMLGLLTEREMCVCEVMVALGLTQPTASHHLRILEAVGLVRDRKEGKWVFYRLADAGLVKALLAFDVER
jgi:DNA-binding transcriptional ArsR family regulator